MRYRLYGMQLADFSISNTPSFISLLNKRYAVNWSSFQVKICPWAIPSPLGEKVRMREKLNLPHCLYNFSFTPALSLKGENLWMGAS